MITRDLVRQALKQAGLCGQTLCIHASMRAFGDGVENGAQGLMDVFLEEGCTVMTPAFSYDYLCNPVMDSQMPLRNAAGNYAWYREHVLTPGIYDVSSKALSLEDMGVFARAVLMHERALRGNHPLNSFAAVGERAKELIAPQTWPNVYAPFEQLCAMDGLVLLMGTTLKNATILHYAEQLAGRTPFVRWAKDKDGKVRCFSEGGCSNGFEQLAASLAHLEKRIAVGNSIWRIYPARQMADAAAEVIRSHPMITHCENPACMRCNDAVQGGPILPEDFWDHA